MNGHAFLSLTESRLEHVGVSFGFQIQVIDILENLVCIVDHLALTIDHRRGKRDRKRLQYALLYVLSFTYRDLDSMDQAIL